MSRKLYKAAIWCKWLTSKNYTPVGFMLWSVWIHTILVMVSVAFRLGWLLTFAVLFSFPMSWLLYVGWLLFAKKKTRTELTDAEIEEAEANRTMMED